MRFESILDEHEKDYMAILKELNPEELKRYVKKKKEKDERFERDSRNLDEFLKREKRAWLKAGGKP